MNKTLIVDILICLDYFNDSDILTLFTHTQLYKNLWYNKIIVHSIKDYGSYWYIYGRLHREYDQPALIWFNNYSAWYFNGKLCREYDNPAIEWNNGDKQWWIDGRLYRTENHI